MPELPEVETIKRGLDKLLPGLRVKSVKSDWEKSFPNSKNDTKKFLIGAVVVRVRRRAKVLLIDLNTAYSLIIHLKMTGQLVYVKKQIPRPRAKVPAREIRFGAGHPTASLVGSLPDRSTRVILNFTVAKLYFNDQRKFGWIKLIPTVAAEQMDFFQKLGPEPLETDFDYKDFIARLLRRKNSRIKPVIMDQSVIAGVGNIYADEALWGAKIHPETRVKDLDQTQINKLLGEIIYVLKLSVEKGGSTDKNYVDAEGKAGSYLSFAKVFRRENQACPRCGTCIIKLKVAARGTHICPVCQAQP